jgi:nicotinamide mononucleotide transporter
MTAADAETWLAAAWGGVSPLEGTAAVLGVLYVVLAIRQHRACWLAALGSTALYCYVFFGAALYMQAALQVYYLAVALYGWRAWRGTSAAERLPVTRASWRLQAVAIVLVVAASATSAAVLARETGSKQPVLDSLTTWASVFATWLVARKKLDNWAWWFVVDSLIVVLCWQQRLYASMILYGLFLGLVVIGWRTWQRDRTRR